MLHGKWGLCAKYLGSSRRYCAGWWWYYFQPVVPLLLPLRYELYGHEQVPWGLTPRFFSVVSFYSFFVLKTTAVNVPTQYVG